MSKKYIIVGVSGGSGSGKTTFAQLLQEKLGKDICGVVAQDSYYIDQSARFTGDGESVNFDHPNSLDFLLLEKNLIDLIAGKNIEIPIYDFVTHKRKKESVPFAAKRFVLVDGTLLFSQPQLMKLFDYTFHIDTPEEIRFARRLQRDTHERGRKPEGVYKQFTRQVKPMHDAFIEPAKTLANTLISGLEDFSPHIDFWAKKLSEDGASFS